MHHTFLTARSADKIFDRSRASRYRDVDAGIFPPGIENGANTRLYPSYEIAALQVAVMRGVPQQVRQELTLHLLALRRRVGAIGEDLEPATLLAKAEAAAGKRSAADTEAAVMAAVRAVRSQPDGPISRQRARAAIATAALAEQRNQAAAA